MSYTNGLDKPTDYFNTVLWTGDGNDDRNITGVGFQPDMVWEKKRSEAGSHRIADSIRGATNVLFPDLTNAETSRPNEFQSFISDGFQIGDDDNFNGSSKTYVGWSWKAGTSFTNDASSTGIGSIDSSGSVSDVSGFSICSFTGTGSNGTIKHGLSTAPRMIIFKQRNGTGYWLTYHASIGAGTILRLDTNDAKSDSSVWFQNTDPTSSVFSVGTSSNNNGSSNTYIAYCLAEKKGYSKFGSYTGNGNADGTFVYTGFKPAWVMIKRTDGANGWCMFDNKRDPENTVDKTLFAHVNNAESTGIFNSDFLSNGFKIRDTDADWNASGGTYVYMTFAENPFVTSTGVPNNAR
jgi:hypothetical protein